jgi:hypothetical protein
VSWPITVIPGLIIFWKFLASQSFDYRLSAIRNHLLLPRVNPSGLTYLIYLTARPKHLTSTADRRILTTRTGSDHRSTTSDLACCVERKSMVGGTPKVRNPHRKKGSDRDSSSPTTVHIATVLPMLLVFCCAHCESLSKQQV